MDLEIKDWVYYHRVDCNCVSDEDNDEEESAGIRVVIDLDDDMMPVRCMSPHSGANDWWHARKCVYLIHLEVL